jgi:hypothetical protein
MASSSAERARKYRAKMRAAGLRPVTIWVPDLRSPEAKAEYRRQSALVGRADRADTDQQSFMDAALDDLLGRDDGQSD